jgi:hypothetical protein
MITIAVGLFCFGIGVLIGAVGAVFIQWGDRR